MRSENKWAVLALTGLAVVLSLTTWFSVTAILPELVAERDLTPGQAAWMTNAVQAGFVIGALASSLISLADIMSLTRLMAMACLLAAVVNAVPLLDPSVSGMIAGRFATGVALAAIYPPSLKFIATWFRTGRGLAMGAMVGALSLGSALPHLVRAANTSVAWQPVVIASSLASLAAAALFAFALREGPHRFARTTVDPRQIGAILRDKPLMLANAGYFGHMWELYAMWAWILAYATAAQAEGLALTAPSLLAFAVIALGAPGSVIAGWMADRIGRCLTTSLMMIVSGLSGLALCLVFAGPLWAFVVVALIWGLTVVSDSAQFSAAVTELSDETRVGSALAFQMGVGFAITIFVIWLLPQVAQTLGSWRWTFLILVPGPVLGTLAMMRLRRMPEAHKLAGGRR